MAPAVTVCAWVLTQISAPSPASLTQAVAPSGSIWA